MVLWSLVSGQTGSLPEKTQTGSLTEPPAEVGATRIKDLNEKDQTGTVQEKAQKSFRTRG